MLSERNLAITLGFVIVFMVGYSCERGTVKHTCGALGRAVGTVLFTVPFMDRYHEW
jgi:hypothetical protein